MSSVVGKTEVVDGAVYPVAALAVENDGAVAADGPASLDVAEVGGMMLAIAAWLVELGAGADGGVMAEKDGESVGNVNPCVAVAPDLLIAVELIGGGAKEFVVDGVVKGAVGDAIPALPGME